MNLVCLVQEAEALKHHLVTLDIRVCDRGLDLVEIVVGQAVQAVLTTDTGKLQIVPTDVNDFFLFSDRHLIVVLHLTNYVALELLKNEVAGLQDLLPRLDRLTIVRQALAPHVHSCAVLGRLQVPIR